MQHLVTMSYWLHKYTDYWTRCRGDNAPRLTFKQWSVAIYENTIPDSEIYTYKYVALSVA